MYYRIINNNNFWLPHHIFFRAVTHSISWILNRYYVRWNNMNDWTLQYRYIHIDIYIFMHKQFDKRWKNVKRKMSTSLTRTASFMTNTTTKSWRNKRSCDYTVVISMLWLYLNVVRVLVLMFTYLQFRVCVCMYFVYVFCQNTWFCFLKLFWEKVWR